MPSAFRDAQASPLRGSVHALQADDVGNNVFDFGCGQRYARHCRMGDDDARPAICSAVEPGRFAIAGNPGTSPCRGPAALRSTEWQLAQSARKLVTALGIARRALRQAGTRGCKPKGSGPHCNCCFGH